MEDKEPIRDESTKDLYQDVPEDQRESILKDNCYACEETSVTRHYGEEEIAELKEKLAEASIQFAKLAAEKAKITKDLDSKMKPHKLEIGMATQGLRERSYDSEEIIYMMDNQTEGVMDIFDSKGKYLYSRRLYEKERQRNVFSIGEKKAG